MSKAFEKPPVPFKIEIPQSELDDLSYRLSRARWPEADTAPSPEDGIESGRLGMGWGPKLDLMKSLVKRWETDYSWRKEEAKMNQVKNFKVEIEDLSIHFIHEVSPSPNAIPLILCHGWPGTAHEFSDLIPRLTHPKEGQQAFHVVAADMPGYAFSSPPTRVWHMEDTARVLNTLMLGLGYDKYAAQGGDWGSITVRCLGALHPEHCKVVHLNFCPSGDTEETAKQSTPHLEKHRAAAKEFATTRFSYYHIQKNTPRTAAYGLNDSPIGILAWMAEKLLPFIYHAESMPSPTMTHDFLFTTCCLFYFTNSIGTSFLPYTINRFISEFLLDPKYFLPNFAISIFPGEILIAPRESIARTGNLKWYKEADDGSHFAAAEKPDLLAEHLRESIVEIWPSA